jgi:hypothetical protein
MKVSKREILLWVIILIPYICLIPASYWHFNQLKKIENSSFIIINKADFTLSHYNYRGELLQKSSIALGQNPGNKVKIGDLKTPEGIFRIAGFEDASTWSHDFKGDSLGKIEGAYGPYFIRLDVPGQKGIGIHGTHDDLSIGTRASEGCIRMHNEDVAKLVKNFKTASIVVIVPGLVDIKENKQVENGTKSASIKSTVNKKKTESNTTPKKKSSTAVKSEVKSK